MIPNRWYAILDASELGRRPIGVTRLGERLALWRQADGTPACVADRCPHRFAALSPGPVHGDCLACPFHGFEFDRDGRCTLIPANGRGARIPQAMHVKSFPVREEHGLIFAWHGEVPAQLPPIPWFDELPGYGLPTLRDEWDVHYSRAIENQLDIPHVPFVHRTTIGRKVGPVVDGPPATIDGDALRIWFSYRDDDGAPAKGPKETAGSGPPQVTFLFPNLWRLRLSPKLHQFIAFAPVDEERSVLYVRTYQQMVGLPGLRWLFNRIGMVGNRFVLNQDKAVVLTQRPKASAMLGGERLVASDWPIALYRKRRDQLQRGIAEANSEASAETPDAAVAG